jgi:anthranilate synthase component I
MNILPPFEAFAAAYGRGQAQVVSTKLVADLETPVSVMLKLARNSAYGFLLESVEGGAVRGRYSMIGLKPDLIWRVEGAKAADQPQGAGRSRRPVPAPRRGAARRRCAC